MTENNPHTTTFYCSLSVLVTVAFDPREIQVSVSSMIISNVFHFYRAKKTCPHTTHFSTFSMYGCTISKTLALRRLPDSSNLTPSSTPMLKRLLREGRLLLEGRLPL